MYNWLDFAQTIQEFRMEFVPNFDPEEHHPWFPPLKKCPTNLFRDFQAQMQRSLVTEAYPIPCKVDKKNHTGVFRVNRSLCTLSDFR